MPRWPAFDLCKHRHRHPAQRHDAVEDAARLGRRLMIRKSVLKWGVARIIKTDNGSDFVAVATKQLFEHLDIDVDVSDAFSPEQKGHVERMIRTFQHEVGPQLPGYIGHSVAERKAIEGRRGFADRLGADEREVFEVALTAEQLQAHIDDWLDYVYHEREHGGLDKRTPNAVAARARMSSAASTSAPSTPFSCRSQGRTACAG